MEQGQLQRLALVYVQGRRLDAEGDEADVAAMRQDAIEGRCVSTPGKTGKRPLVAAQHEVGAAVVQVGQGFRGAGGHRRSSAGTRHEACSALQVALRRVNLLLAC